MHGCTKKKKKLFLAVVVMYVCFPSICELWVVMYLKNTDCVVEKERKLLHKIHLLHGKTKPTIKSTHNYKRISSGAQYVILWLIASVK
jgi:hypothetical protein